MKRFIKGTAQLLLIWAAIAGALIVAGAVLALIDAPVITHIGGFTA